MRFVLAMLFVVLPAVGALTKPIASYDIKARLDTKEHVIHGSEVLTWVNNSPDTIPALRFHLYMNAFRDQKSTFMRESGGGQLRGDRFKKKRYGSVGVSKMRIAGGADLTPAIRCIAPDDGNKNDCTVIEAALPEPVKPGQTLQLEIEFVTKLPEIFARTGVAGNYYLIGQWFPKIGVWETKGFRRVETPGWNCHQFHANSEFFANFGNYRAELTLPSNFVVGATGEQMSRTEDKAKGTATHTFAQEDVTDFAWTAQPNFLRLERPFAAAKETTPEELKQTAKLHGISEDEARLSDVKMIVLLQPEHAHLAERHFHATRTAIKWFGLFYGRYPYKTITVVDPPDNGGGSGGMEYPTFITAGTNRDPAPDEALLEEVTVHEFGHQFWMQLVASNEFEEPWMDEGVNTYSTSKIMEKVYGKMALPITVFGLHAYKWMGLPLIGHDGMNRAAYLSQPASDPMTANSWSMMPGSYGINAYMRPGTFLRSLEKMLGEEKMARAMRAYHQKWRFGHPTGRDFQQSVEESSGQDLDWFFSQFVFGNRRLDYKVERVTWKDANPKDDAEKAKNGKTGGKQELQEQEITVVISRRFDGRAPVDVVVRFSDGSTERRSWDGEQRWAKFVFRKKAKPERVEVDPGQKFLIDESFANNGWMNKPNAALLASWTGTALWWLQNLLIGVSGLI